MPLTVRRFYAIIVAGLTLGLLALAGCSGTASTSPNGSGGTGTATANPTATASTHCTQFVPAATPFSGVSGVPGLQLPAGSYIGSGKKSGEAQANIA
jgi:hypothetical protein